MGRQLLLLRHAKSDWESDAPSDFERPLAKRGRKAAPKIAGWLKAQALTPDRIISSPAERARQTTLAVAKVIGVQPAKVRWEPELYEASVDTLLSVIRSCPNARHRLMLVGHNPGLADLLEWCCEDGTPGLENVKVLPTAAVAVLAFDSRWGDIKRGSASLVDLVRPRELGKRGLA